MAVAPGEGTLGLEDGLTVQLEVPAGAAVRDLRALIEDRAGLPGGRQVLLVGGRAGPGGAGAPAAEEQAGRSGGGERETERGRERERQRERGRERGEDRGGVARGEVKKQR